MKTAILSLRRTDAADPVPRRRPRAGRLLLLAVVVAAVASVAGVIAATHIKSPAELAAETAPPTPSVLTAQVTRQVIHTTVVFRGSVTNPHQVTAAAGVAGPEGAAQPVITATPMAKGGVVHAGDVLVEVAGRPVVALPGAVPGYRDLKPGLAGKDVAELQAALRALGHGTGSDRSGVFGSGTKSAVSAFYVSLGYAVPTSGDSAALEAAKQALTQAQRALATLQQQGAAGSPDSSVPYATRLAWAQQDVQSAQAAYSALAAAAGPMVPVNEVLFVPQLPATLVGVAGGVGDAAKPPVVTVAVGEPVVSGRLDPSEAQSVKAGQQVKVSDDLRGYQGAGQVTAVGELTTDTSTNGGGTPYVPVTVVVAGLPQNLVGDDVQLSIDVSQGDQTPALAVPASAIFARVDGQLYVTVLRDGQQVQVPVTAGATGDGWVAVTPIGSAALSESDTVVLGLGHR